MSYAGWYAGMKIVCISDKYRPSSAPSEGDAIPRKGQVYTIRGFHRSGNIWLVEIVNRRRLWVSGRHEYAFHPSRFRPVQHRKTDISMFQALLNPSKPDAKRPVKPAREPTEFPAFGELDPVEEIVIELAVDGARHI